ncbi:hypothetical protein EOC93_32995 [Mesorhizobium sp. M6A.T.Ce.TU.002.03.1.1]|uniref:hypothetical protein n=1 Tax=unclassified Mesorhizobium TaxID=325217 RepID=UPI000FC9A676|nr:MULTISPECIES: hypothetical protein [unclassified Mesorhizobium]RUU25903.1 hypothetical protein EOD08_22960 [Mesorhizobium sp. M6A.T.Ca.TU.002.02.2.1]RUU27272.1 hypothetical protein EOC93_32995 [Mesorhizobium sp. M6A.T.Ce.TU.002.03.1.1]RUU29593.1 hypothetical protein EOC94_11975 [Mesorhizobium sp. M6A.T.Ce.TU.016.01.1.1]RUU98039.1 hypothetical protein EOB36_25050 [Mesorhizobium sp. M6A.T.Cr.TU.017.01.1.1]RWO95860.1 MAG: hypothetical protein EOQ98_25035 [Mesorhizobium sp.]
MNFHVNAAGIDADWQFELGAWITHRDQPMPSLVLSRAKAGKLGDVYGVRSFATVDPNRDRMILGSLKPIDDAAWAVCLLTPEWAAELAA